MTRKPCLEQKKVPASYPYPVILNRKLGNTRKIEKAVFTEVQQTNFCLWYVFVPFAYTLCT